VRYLGQLIIGWEGVLLLPEGDRDIAILVDSIARIGLLRRRSRKNDPVRAVIVSEVEVISHIEVLVVTMNNVSKVYRERQDALDKRSSPRNRLLH
jgi:hypothetical protein